jgi:hypothetical protein
MVGGQYLVNASANLPLRESSWYPLDRRWGERSGKAGLEAVVTRKVPVPAERVIHPTHGLVIVLTVLF